jgi:hypothetical protein
MADFFVPCSHASEMTVVQFSAQYIHFWEIYCPKNGHMVFCVAPSESIKHEKRQFSLPGGINIDGAAIFGVTLEVTWPSHTCHPSWNNETENLCMVLASESIIKNTISKNVIFCLYKMV